MLIWVPLASRPRPHTIVIVLPTYLVRSPARRISGAREMRQVRQSRRRQNPRPGAREPDQILQSINYGRNGVMPAWGQVIDQKGLENVTAYVQSLNGSEVSADVAAGKQVYAMYCSSCHGADGLGNQLMGAPNLTNNTWLYGGSSGQILQTISAGRNGIMPAHNELLSDEKIHLLTAYVYGLSKE